MRSSLEDYKSQCTNILYRDSKIATPGLTNELYNRNLNPPATPLLRQKTEAPFDTPERKKRAVIVEEAGGQATKKVISLSVRHI